MTLPSRLLQQRYLVYAVIVVLLLLTVNVLRNGLANILAHDATYELANGSSLTAGGEAMQGIEERLLLAWQLSGEDPNLSEELGSFYIQQARLRETDYAQQDADYEKALTYFADSAQQRPVSPYAWANIVLLKFYLGQEDAQFRKAIHNATLLGLKTREVQLIVGEVGLATWKRLDDETRESVTAILRQGLVYQEKDLVRIAQFHNKLDVLCALEPLAECKEIDE
jgi:hypothetical protein